MPLEDLEPLRAELADQTTVAAGVSRIVGRFVEILTDLRDRLDPAKNVNRSQLQAEITEIVEAYDAQNAAIAAAVAIGTAAADEVPPPAEDPVDEPTETEQP